MQTHRTLISKWPSLEDFAEDIGVVENTAKQMAMRNSVNGGYWLAAAQGAERRGIDGASLEIWAKAAARTKEGAAE